MGSIPRSVANQFQLELDGTPAGFVKSVAGGDITADVVVVASGSDTVQKKHISGVNYEELVLGIGLGMARGFYDWIADSWAGKAQRRNGAIVEADQRFEAKARREFRDALITETTIPELGGAAKTAAQLTVKIAPESITRKKASGNVRGTVGTKQKQWLASNFRFELEGLDAKRITKIDAFTVKQLVASVDTGTARDFQRTPTRVEFPNLRVTLAESAAQTWLDWFEDFVIRGNNGDDREKNGAIVFLDPALKNELGRIELKNVGIFALRRPSSVGEQIPHVVAELYVETMTFDWSSAEEAAPEPAPAEREREPVR